MRKVPRGLPAIVAWLIAADGFAFLGSPRFREEHSRHRARRALGPIPGAHRADAAALTVSEWVDAIVNGRRFDIDAALYGDDGRRAA